MPPIASRSAIYSPPSMFDGGGPSSSATVASTSDGCAVCGDRINGSRYGAPACLGCIVFFRRAVTNDVSYKCLKGGGCVITNESRCICRYCRLQKCYTVGMKASAIQRRDVMGPRKPKKPSNAAENRTEIAEEVVNLNCNSTVSCSGSVTFPASLAPRPFGLLDSLCRLQERQMSQHRSFFVALEASPIVDGDLFSIIMDKLTCQNDRRARAHDVNSMIRLALCDASIWANQFTPFKVLPTYKKKDILSEFAFTFMLVDQGFRTMNDAKEGFWLLQNGNYMCADYYYGLPEADRLKKDHDTKAKLHPDFVKSSIDLVGRPMKELQIDEYEMAAVKTILLLSQRIHFEEGTFSQQVNSIQARCINELMEYLRHKDPSNYIVRSGELFLLPCTIRTSIKALYQQTILSETFDLMSFDALIHDTLLASFNDKEKEDMCKRREQQRHQPPPLHQPPSTMKFN